MIFLGALLTALNLYDNIAKFGGAGPTSPFRLCQLHRLTCHGVQKRMAVLGLAAKRFVVSGAPFWSTAF